mgnify:CR=1 FL=1
MNTRVSILIPIYKAEEYIEECLCSVFEQTYHNIEYVLVNDCTPDNSMQIVKDTLKMYPQRAASVKIIENEINKGITYTRNILWENASGDYIYYVDSDDFIANNAIEIFVKAAEKENADIVRCNFNRYTKDKITQVSRKPPTHDEDMLTHCLAHENAMTFLWLLFIRRELFTMHNLFFPEDIFACEDFLMTIKLFYYTNKIIDIPDSLYFYRVENEQSITHNEKEFRINACHAFERIAEFLREQNIYERYREFLLKQMFTCKQNFLLSKSIRDIPMYINTFPESNKYYKLYKYSKKQQLLFYLAEHKFYFLLKLFCKLN